MRHAVGGKPLRLAVLPKLYMALAKPSNAEAANRMIDIAAARRRRQQLYLCAI
jgi:hypothetical protein